MIGAIDIGGTKIAVGIVGRSGVIAARRSIPTASVRDFSAAIEQIAAMIRACERESGVRVEGVGIGSTGPIDPIKGTIENAELLPGWHGAPLVAQIEATLGVPAAMENDADAAALAESQWGAGRGISRFLYVTISTGIGSGFVIDGELYRGIDGAHPEAGHMPIDASGPLCYCGVNGCWESLAAGPAIENWYAAESGQRVPAEAVFERARQGDNLGVQAVSRQAHYLGLGLTALTTAFCPEVIALGGGVMRNAEQVLPDARATVLRLATQVPAEKVRIERALLGDDLGLAGGACVWLHRFETKLH